MDHVCRVQKLREETVTHRRYFHTDKVRLNEDVCAVEPACLAHCAARWLEQPNEFVKKTARDWMRR